ncbi:thioesterase family protein [Paraglaciecola aestuariivivens]
MTSEELRTFVIDFFNSKMPFNQLLGMSASLVESEQVAIHLNWSDQLMGNPVHKILHGGVTAAVLDTVGSLAALVYGINGLSDEQSVEDFYQQLPNGGTLDMRVDYLRPGKGQEFIATAKVIRRGKRIAVCRMELHNEHNLHIATGTGSYIF